MAKLTDRKLAQLLNTMSAYYKQNPDDIYNFVYYSMQVGGPYCDLDVEEKNKVWQVFRIFQEAILGLTPDQIQKEDAKNKRVSNKDPSIFYPWHGSSYHNNTFIFINSGSYPSHSHGHSSGGSGCFGSCCSGSGDAKETLIFILVGILIAIIAAIALAAASYLLSQALNDLDRIWHNEGRFQAVVSLSFMAGTAVAVGMLMNLLLTGAFASFLLGVGFSNPIGLAIFTVFCITGIATALINPIRQVVQGKATELLNPQALDPTEPSRFTLTNSEASRLEKKGIDPLRVKCAIVALHASLQGESTDLYKRDSFFEGRSYVAKDVLNEIRQLRKGELTEVKVKGLNFNCTKTEYTPIAWDVTPVASVFALEPSAPPITSTKVSLI